MRAGAVVRAMCFCAALAISAVASAQSAAAPQQASNVPVCAGCHEDKWTSIAMSAHGAKNDASGSMCQACHGDASEHIKDPANAKPANPFSRLTPATAGEQSNVCLACHAGHRELTF